MASEKICSTELANDFSCSDESFNAHNLDTVTNIEESCHEGCKESKEIPPTDIQLKKEAIGDSQNVKDSPKYLDNDDLSNQQRSEASSESEYCDSSLSCQDYSIFLDDDSTALEASNENISLIESDIPDIDNRSDLETQEVVNTSYNLADKSFDPVINDDGILKKCLEDDNANSTFQPSDTTESRIEDEACNNNKIVNEYSFSNSEVSDKFETGVEVTENYMKESAVQVASNSSEDVSLDPSEGDSLVAFITKTSEIQAHTVDQQNNVCLVDDSNVNELIKLSPKVLAQQSLLTDEKKECVTEATSSNEPIENINIEVQDICLHEIPQDDQKYSLLDNVTVPSIAEENSYKECNTHKRNVVEFDDILGTASPTLRRSGSNNYPSRQDCRSLFNENSEEILLEDKIEYNSLTDSLELSHKESSTYSLITKEENTSADHPITDPETKSSSNNEVKCVSLKDDLARFTKSIPYKKKKTSQTTCKGRRVSFPEDDASLITSYLEPANPWNQMNDVTTDDISQAYQNSCFHHSTRALPLILQQIIALPVQVGGRIERLSFRRQKLDGLQVECLEEIFKRVQFKTLDFEECSLDDDTAIPLFDMIEFYDSASHLNISSNNKIGFRGWQACSRMLKRTPSLKLLDARETNLNEQHMPILCRALRIGAKLHTVHLENCNLTGRPLITLAGALRLNDTISDLYLGDNRLGTNDSIHIGNLVCSNKTLKLLDLRNNNMQDAGCDQLCKAITDQQMNEKDSSVTQVGLITLNLWNNYLTINSIPHLSNMLSASVTLQTLNLGRNYLTSEGILLIKNSLIRNRTLVRLGLQSTRLGNEGAVALAECVVDNPVISRIDLRENSIQVAGLMALSRSLALSSNIVQLDLDSNPRAEPTPDLLNQHIILQKEIKSLCQKNQVEVHCKSNFGDQEAHNIIDDSFDPDPRKISLTCESMITSPIAVAESKRYWSPAPSPSISPCPSPSLSPSPSPMPSPLRNRFRVFKVTDDLLSTSAPATLSHSMSGSLPALNNRFLLGKRFTVTNVSDPAAPMRAMSSPSLIYAVEGPTIVVSSPNNSIKGFDLESKIPKQKERSNSIDLLTKPLIESPTSDDVFEASPVVKINPERKQAVFNSPCLDSLLDNVPLPKAPLAAMEAGSFDSDSEDSELTTQSSDSTRSDEVKVSSSDQIVPIVAWEMKSDKNIPPIESTNEDRVTH